MDRGIDYDGHPRSQTLYVPTHRFDLPCTVGAENMGELVRNLECARQSPKVEPVQGRGLQTNYHLVPAGLRIGQIHNRHILETVFVDSDGFHAP